jgi:hypothetical protein
MEQRHTRYVDPMELRGRMDTLRAEELRRIARGAAIEWAHFLALVRGRKPSPPASSCHARAPSLLRASPATPNA